MTKHKIGRIGKCVSKASLLVQKCWQNHLEFKQESPLGRFVLKIQFHCANSVNLFQITNKSCQRRNKESAFWENEIVCIGFQRMHFKFKENKEFLL